MVNHQKSIEISDPETGEIVALNMGSLVGDIRDVLISKRRQQIASVLWGSLTEDQQKDEIVAATQLAEDLVEKACDLIATAGRDVIHAKLDNFKIKGGEVTVTAKGLADDGAVLALNHVGTKSLKIIVADAGKFDQERGEIRAEADQPAMFGDEAEPDVSDLYQRAVDAVRAEDVASTSFVQRSLGIGYNKAARLVEMMEEEGVISAPDGVGKRAVLPPEEDGGADLAAEMDAALDEIEEPDDLHATGQEQQEAEAAAPSATPEEAGPEAEEATEAAPDPRQAGFSARLSGAGPDECPFDGGTAEHAAWVSGYEAADGEIEALERQGYEARADGQGPQRCTFKEGSDARRFWMRGYERRKDEERSEEDA